jgi:transketolase
LTLDGKIVYSYHDSMTDDELTKIASLIRATILQITNAVGSGHPTTCFSSVELMTMLFFKYLRTDLSYPESITNDRVIISKGHASALLYSLYYLAQGIDQKELTGYRNFASTLEGHPTFRFKYTEAATGSLGQGLSIGAGEAWSLRKKFEVRSTTSTESAGGVNKTAVYDSTIVPFSIPRVFVLLGDGETAEGSVWEAAAWAAHEKLSNLIAIVDVNRYGQSEETMLGTDLETYRARFEAFGWGVIVIDGHDWGQIDAAFEKAITYHKGPVAIIAKTKKGKGITLWEDQNGWHNKMLPKDELEKALARFKKAAGDIWGEVQKPDINSLESRITNQELGIRNQESGIKNQELKSDTHNSNFMIQYSESTPTKLAFGNALVRLGGTYSKLLVLDGDVSNSLHTDLFKNQFPNRFVQMYIAEQNMVGVSVGMAKMGYKPVVNTFAAFLSRAHDQIRMIPLSDVTVIFNGSYVGVSVGRDGPSQMGLEDIALFRSVYGSTVLYPGDAYATEKLVEVALTLKGVVYVRTTREPTPVIYKPTDKFHLGGSYVFKPGKLKETVTVVAAGITLKESLDAQKSLINEGIGIRVIDAYSIKPIDTKTLFKAASETKAIIVVEDHYPEGGLGEAVKSALAEIQIPIYHLSVTQLPHSGSAAELMDFENISASSINQMVKKIL